MKRVTADPRPEEAQGLEAQLATLRHAAELIATSDDLERVAADSLAVTMKLVGAVAGSIHVATPDGTQLVRRAAVGMPDAYLPESIPAARIGRWVGDVQPGIFDLDGSEQRPRQQAAWRGGIRRIFFVPLGDVAQPIGLMALGCEIAGPLPASLVDTVAAVARLQRAAISNASVHEQKRLANLRLEEQYRRFAATLEHLPIAIHILNRQGDIVHVNEAGRAFQRNFMGNADGGAPGQAWTDRLMKMSYFELSGRPLPLGELPLARAFRGELTRGEEIRLVSPDRQQEMYAIASAQPVRFAADGTVEEVVAVITDVTEQRALAESKDHFLRIASHELRSPLTSLRATTGLLELDPTAIADPARRQQLIARVNRQVDRLAHLVEQLVDKARLNSKELPLSPEPAQLDELCRQALQHLAPAAHGRTITIETHGDLSGAWDRLRIEQIITNLVDNAVRHSEATRPIVVRLEGDDREVKIQIIDQGDGVPADQLDRLFTPFFRARNASHRGGLGLGLYISSEIVRRHGGKIAAERQTTGGMVFSVTLPKQPGEPFKR